MTEAIRKQAVSRIEKLKMTLSKISALSILLALTLLLEGCGSNGSNNPVGNAVAPEAAFDASTYIGSFPLYVVFNATTSSDSDGSISLYEWQFGDGAAKNGSIVTHTYSTAGTYKAQLTVTDNDGYTDTCTKEIEVKPKYSLGGTVTTGEYIETDSDVNDPNASYAPNNSFDEAQEVSSPNSISGYVNLPYRGNNGRSYFIGDTEDYYLVTLGQETDITLYMAAEPDSSELELYLYDEQQNLKDSTFTDERGLASLIVPASGIYFVRIVAADYASLTTASIYLLTMGKSGITAGKRSPRLSDNFVLGQALVQFEEEDPASLSGTENGSSMLKSMGLFTEAKDSTRNKLWRRSETMDKNSVFGRLGIQSILAVSLAQGKAKPDIVSRMETLWMLRALKREEDVRIAEPNYIRRYHAVEPNDSYYPYQWHYPLIGLPEAWEITTGSNDVTVAVIDSGILKNHPDLADQIIDGYDFVSDPDYSMDGDGIDNDPEDPGDGDINGSSFHGTHTAGTIAARTNNNKGVAGVAWKAKIMPLRVLGYGGMGTTADILEAVKYAAGLETDAGIQLENPVDIINLSLGGEGYSQIEEEIFQEVRDQGVIVVASAGNEGSNGIMYPAGYKNVVSVSAVDINGDLALYSNYGTTIDVAAPGGSSTDINGDGYMDGVLSTVGDDSSGAVQMGYSFYTGTSMAAPHVSGVAALMKTLFPAMTPGNFDALLTAGYLTRSDSETGRDDKLGYGLIDAYKAVLVAQEGGISGGIPAILSATPGALNFGRLLTTLNVTVENGGDGYLSVDSYYSDASWASITPSADVDENGLGTYIVEVNRDGLDDGIYIATLAFETDSQKIQVSVTMQVGSGGGTIEGGYHYILLLDPDTYITLAYVSSSGSNGSYEFNFTGLAYNRPYLIYAGTDVNNNGYICDMGETCGAYLSLDEPIRLTIREDMRNIDFSTDIRINIPDASANQMNDTSRFLYRDGSKKIP